MRTNETKTHTVKSWPEFFEDIVSGRKTFELRKNDRDYRPGDLLVLKEWQPDRALPIGYTGREHTMRISYVMYGAGVGCVEPLKGLAIGYAILGLMPTAMNPRVLTAEEEAA